MATADRADGSGNEGAVALPPYHKGDDIESGLCCYVCTSFKATTWQQLMEHVRRMHKVSHRQLNGTYLHTMARAEISRARRLKYKEHVTVRKADASDSIERKPKFQKQAAEGETAEALKPTSATVANTLIPMPGGCLSKRCVVPASAAQLLVASGFLDEHETPTGITYRWNGIVPVELQEEQLLDAMPSCRQREVIAQVLGGAAGARSTAGPPCPSEVAQLLGPPQLNIQVADEAMHYVKPSNDVLDANVDRRRFSWPCKSVSSIDLSEVEQYIRQTSKKEGTIDAHTRGVKYFFALFAYPAGKHTLIDVFKTLYKDKLIHKVMTLDILHPSISWTRLINDALCKLTDFIVLAADDIDDADGMKIASSCKTRFVVPLRKKLSAETDQQRTRRNEIDKVRVRNFPSIELMNASARQAMFDISVIHSEYIESYKKTHKIPPIVRRALNTMAYGTSAYRTFPGRPGEWGRMKYTKVKECLDDDRCWYLVVTDHKTIKSSGPLGRYMPDDVKHVFRKLVDFCDPSKNLLYEPHSSAKHVQIHKLAADFAKMYTPGHQCPEPTLMRKFSESLVADRRNAEKAQRMAAKVQASEGTLHASSMAADMSGHHASTQKKYYDLNSKDPETHAAASRAYIEEFIGDVLPPPTPEELDANKDRTAEVILCQFQQLTGRGGDDGKDSDALESEGNGIDCASDADECSESSDVTAGVGKTQGTGVVDGHTYRDIRGYMKKKKVADTSTDNNYQKGKKAKTDSDAKQITDAATGGPRGKKSAIPDAQKNWILQQCVEFLGSPHISVGEAPPAPILREIFNRGVSSGNIMADTRYQQVRHIARNWR